MKLFACCAFWSFQTLSFLSSPLSAADIYIEKFNPATGERAVYEYSYTQEERDQIQRDQTKAEAQQRASEARHRQITAERKALEQTIREAERITARQRTSPRDPDRTEAKSNKGAFNPRTGEYYPPVAGGVINPRTGEFHQEVAGGYIRPSTGEFMPKIGP